MEPPLRDREIIQKLCLLGDANSRKTDLIRPLVWHNTSDKYITTLGTKVTKKTLAFDITVGGSPVQILDTLLVWDILGQKQYSRLHPVYYQGAAGALVFCYLGGPDAVASVTDWVGSFRQVTSPLPMAIVVNCGTRASLEAADPEAIRGSFQALGLPVFLSCPETPERTEEAVVHVARRMTEDYIQRKGLPAEGPLVSAAPRPREKRRWFRRLRKRGRTERPPPPRNK